MKKMTMLVSLLLITLLLAGCSQSTTRNADLAAVMSDLEGKYGLSEMMALTEEDLMELYGIAQADVKQFAARLPWDSLNADEVVLIEAADDAAAARVKEKLDNRYQNKLNETRDYLPAEYEKISACSVSSSGKYVALIVSAEAKDMTADYQKAFK